MASGNSDGFLPRTDDGLLAWSTNFKDLIHLDPEAYGLDDGQSDAYGALHTAYATALQLAVNPSTRTRPNVAAKNSARAALMADARLLAKIVEGTGTVTDAQKLALGLNVRKQPSPIPAPTARPGVDLVSSIDRVVTIHIHDSTSSSKRGKPAGAVAAWVYTFVGESYPSDPAMWAFQGAATKAKFEIAFANTLPGGTQVWICAAWVNAKGEAGPTNVPITTNLQGGGSSSAVNAELKLAA